MAAAVATLLLVLSPRGAVAVTRVITNANIQAAVAAWATNPTTASTTYGPIGEWNVGAVSNMNYLTPSLRSTTTSLPGIPRRSATWATCSSAR